MKLYRIRGIHEDSRHHRHRHGLVGAVIKPLSDIGLCRVMMPSIKWSSEDWMDLEFEVIASVEGLDYPIGYRGGITGVLLDEMDVSKEYQEAHT